MWLKVTYTEGINEKLDKKITKFFTDIGFEWEGQGVATNTGERDITFVKNNRE